MCAACLATLFLPLTAGLGVAARRGDDACMHHRRRSPLTSVGGMSENVHTHSINQCAAWNEMGNAQARAALPALTLVFFSSSTNQPITSHPPPWNGTDVSEAAAIVNFPPFVSCLRSIAGARMGVCICVCGRRILAAGLFVAALLFWLYARRKFSVVAAAAVNSTTEKIIDDYKC